MPKAAAKDLKSSLWFRVYLDLSALPLFRVNILYMKDTRCKLRHHEKPVGYAGLSTLNPRPHLHP